MVEPTRFDLSQDQMPTAWFNIMPSLVGAGIQPLPPLQQAHLMLVKGKLLETQGDIENALAAYSQGAKLVGDLDLSPTMAAKRGRRSFPIFWPPSDPGCVTIFTARPSCVFRRSRDCRPLCPCWRSRGCCA